MPAGACALVATGPLVAVPSLRGCAGVRLVSTDVRALVPVGALVAVRGLRRWTGSPLVSEKSKYVWDPR